jgi:flagellar hook-associated protein 2
MTSYSINAYTNAYQPKWSKPSAPSMEETLVRAAASHFMRTSPSRTATAPYDQLPENYSKTMANVFKSFNDLSKAALQLTKSNSALNQRTVDTGTSKAFGATAKSGAALAAYQVGVKQTAAAQQNTGGLFHSSGTGAFAAGTHAMKLTLANGKSAAISVHVKAGDTNETVLKNLAGAINNSSLGVKAQAVTAKQNDGTTQTKLVLTASKTGTEAAFSLSDTSGNLAAASGGDQVSTVAKNAEYTVNDQNYTSQSNNVSLDNGKVTLTLQSANAKPETLRIQGDLSAAASDVKGFVKAYNDTLRTLKSASGIPANQKWYTDLTQQSSRANLREIGITVNPDKTLRLDEEKLTKALSAKSDSAQFALTGPGGLVSRVGAQAKTAGSSPLAQYFTSASAASTSRPYEFNLYQSMMNFQFPSMNYGNFMNLYT